MKPVRPLVAVCCAIAAVTIIAYPASAGAIEIHVHEKVPEVVGGVTAGPPIVVPREVVRVIDVAPVDSDDDGFADADDECDHDSYSAGNDGCTPEPVITSYPETAPAPALTSVAVSTDGSCGGITPYYGAGQCWAIPYEIVSCESGGSLTAQNPSGAYGAYQLLGHGEYEGMSKEEQDAMAADVWAGGAGRSAWVC